MKKEPIEGSETSAFKPQTPGKYPKENILHNPNIFEDFVTQTKGGHTQDISCALLIAIFSRQLRSKQLLTLCYGLITWPIDTFIGLDGAVSV